METTVTRAPCASFSRSASSSAYSSKGFIMLSTPSRISVLVSGLIRTFVVSGTCLTQTIMCMAFPVKSLAVGLNPLERGY